MKRIYRLSFLYKAGIVFFCLFIVTMQTLWGDPVWFLPTSSASEIEEALSQPNSPVDAYNQDGHTGLSYAARNGNLPLTLTLLSFGADPNLPSKDAVDPKKRTRNTPLHWAILNGEQPNAFAIARYLMAAGAFIDARNFEGKTPLHMINAITDNRQRSEFIRLLVLNGSDSNSVDNRGNSLTHMLVEMNLLQYMGDIFLGMFGDLINLEIKNRPASDRPGLTPQEYAFYLGFRDMSTLLQDWQKKPIALIRFNNIGLNPLMVAILRKDARLVERLIKENPAFVNEAAKNEFANTSLMYAVLLGEPEIVSYLLQNGANVKARNARQETIAHALLTTPIEKRSAIIKALGTSLTPEIMNSQDIDGNTVLAKAIIGNRVDLVSYLLKQLPNLVPDKKLVAFDLNLQNKNNMTPLGIAKKWNRKQIIDIIQSSFSNT